MNPFCNRLSLAAILLSLCTPLALPTPIRAAEIAWSFQTVEQADLSQPADVTPVSTAGDLHAAVNAGGSATTVKGIPFAAGSGNINFANCQWSVPNVSWGSNASGFCASDATTLLNSANSWLNSGKYHGSTTVPGQLGMTKLTVGNQYQVQLFFADNRSVYSVNGRTVSVDSGVTKTRYSFAPVGGPYGYLAVTGLFTADAASQNVDMQCYSPAGAAVGPQINAFQIRDLGSSVTLAPTFSPLGGTYVGARTVTIECQTPGATIHYTTDGAAPDESSPAGASGLTVEVPGGATMTIQAYALLDGFSDSAVASATYTCLATTSGTWTNPAGGSWTTAANWLSETIPFGATADFGTLDLTADTTVSLDGERPMGHLIFGDTTPSHDWFIETGSAGPLTLGTGSGSPTITVANRTTTIAAELAGSQGMAKAGDGTLVLSGANTYTGTTSLQAGSLVLTDLVSHRSSVATDAGTTVEVVVASDINAANSFNFAGTGTVIKSGAGKWLIGDLGRVGISMSPGGLFDIREGIVSTGNHKESFTGNQGSVNIKTGATLNLQAENLWADSLTGGGSITNTYAPSGGRTVTVGVADGSSTFSGTIGSGNLLGLTKTGTGTQILTGTHGYTRATLISSGTLQLGDGGTSGSLATGSAITTNGTLAFMRSDNISQGIDFSDGVIGGTGGLTQMGPGTLTLSAGNSYTGATLVSGGTLAVGVAPGTNWSVKDLTLENGTSLAIRNFNSDPSNPPVDALEVLSATGSVTIRVAGNFEVGTFPLIYYPQGGEISGDGFDSLALDLPSGVLGRLLLNEDNGSIDLEITEIVLDPYTQWISTNYPSLSGDDALPGSDPDGDGTNNLTEFALKGDPTTGDSRGLTAMSTTDTNANGSKELVLTVAVRSGTTFTGAPSPTATVDAVIYTIQGSLDLADFTAPVTELTPSLSPAQSGLPDIAGSGWEYHSFILSGSEGLPGKGFLRAVIGAE